LRQTPPGGLAFIRRLAELNDAPAAASKEVFAGRLSRWFDWTDAISLSGALACPPGQAREPGAGAAALDDDEREFVRVRAALAGLARANAGRSAPARASRPAVVVADAPAAPAADFAPHRRRYVAAQQAMETQVAALRTRLRERLGAASPELARLAALDAVMEQVLGRRERALLATVPRWLERHFEQLARHDAGERAAAPGATPGRATMPGSTPARPGGWEDVFRQRLAGVLLAELDLRLQPVEALLQALRPSPERHE